MPQYLLTARCIIPRTRDTPFVARMAVKRCQNIITANGSQAKRDLVNKANILLKAGQR